MFYRLKDQRYGQFVAEILQRLIKLQYMHSIPSNELKKPSLNPQSLPHIKNQVKPSTTRKQQLQPLTVSHVATSFVYTSTGTGIKGIIGEAVSFYSHNNLSMKIKPKNTFDSTIKSIFCISKSLKKQSHQPSQQNAQKTQKSQGKTACLSNYVASLKQNYKKSKYFAFQRLVKMNSQQYGGAYHCWLKEKKDKRKVSPIVVRIRNNNIKRTANQESQVCNTLTSNQEEDVVLNSEEEGFFNNRKQKLAKSESKNLDILMKKDIRIHQKQQGKTKAQYFQQLFVTRTNLIKKPSPHLHPTTQKPSSISCQKTPSPPVYKYFLGPGNNSQLIHRILQQTRFPNWIPTTEYDTLYNLRWQQQTEKAVYRGLEPGRYRQFVNHFEMHECITSKAGLVETMRQYWGRLGQSGELFNMMPITFVFDWSEKGKFQEELKKFVYCYCENHPDAERASKIERDFVELSRYLWKGVRQPPNMSFDRNLLKKMGIPTLDPVFKQQNSKYLWIIKPSDYNRGRGIKIFSTLEQLRQIIKQDMPSDSFVIQKYIQKPLLVKTRKFDIRVWVLLTQQNSPYFFSQGYIRTSSQPFSLEYTNPQSHQYIHLTNNAVQKTSSKYGLYEQGNQLGFGDMDVMLGKEEGYFGRVWVPRIRGMCGEVMGAARGKLAGEGKLSYGLNSEWIRETYRVKAKIVNQSLLMPVGEQTTSEGEKVSLPIIISPAKTQKQPTKSPTNSKKSSSFQIFGLDFMVDRQQKLWLIEVNTNPCLQTSSQVLSMLIPRMLDDAFKIVLDPIFKPSPKAKIGRTVYPVPGYEDQWNMWVSLGGGGCGKGEGIKR